MSTWIKQGTGFRLSVGRWTFEICHQVGTGTLLIAKTGSEYGRRVAGTPSPETATKLLISELKTVLAALEGSNG